MTSRNRFALSARALLTAPLLALLLLGTAHAEAVAPAQATAATTVVERLHATLLTLMKEGDSLGMNGRYETVGKVVQDTFDFATIGRIVTGRSWRAADDATRLSFMQSFARLSAATYANRFNEYKGEEFVTDGVEAARGGVLVKTHIVKGSGESVSLDYLLQGEGDDLRIVNVVADGVSDLSLKRADYSAILKDGGFPSLIAELDAKLQAFMQE